MKNIRTTTALALLALALAGCSSSGTPAAAPTSAVAPHTHAAPAMVTVVGGMSLTNTDGWSSSGVLHHGAHCVGWHGYDDVNSGAEVVVSDDKGHTLAITTLHAGHIDHAFDCRFPFRVRVPAGKGFYGIQVTHRGVVKFPESELGHAALSLG